MNWIYNGFILSVMAILFFSVLFKCFVSSDEVLFTSGKSVSAANYTDIVKHDFVLGET